MRGSNSNITGITDSSGVIDNGERDERTTDDDLEDIERPTEDSMAGNDRADSGVPIVCGPESGILYESLPLNSDDISYDDGNLRDALSRENVHSQRLAADDDFSSTVDHHRRDSSSQLSNGDTSQPPEDALTDSLVEAKQALAAARSGANYSDMGRRLTSEHPEEIVAESLVDAKYVLAATEGKGNTPRLSSHTATVSSISNGMDGRGENSGIPSDRRESSNHHPPDSNAMFPTLATAQIVSHTLEDDRARLIRVTRERILAETAHAEPVDVTVDDHEPIESIRQTNRRRRMWWLVGMVFVIAGAGAGAVIGVFVSQGSKSSDLNVPSGAPTTLEPQTETAAPVILLADGRIAFSTTQQLYDAVYTYYEELDNDGVTNASEISIRHGYPMGTWDVSRITNFSRVFDPARTQALDPSRKPSARTSFDEDLGGWDVSRATTMSGMFSAANSFTGQGIDRWNVGRVVDFSFMFFLAEKFNGNLSVWDTSSATKLNCMFMAALSFAGDVSRFDVSRVTTMVAMFSGAPQFTGGDLTRWNVSNVDLMNSMFHAADRFNGNISTWDTSLVTDVRFMFRGTVAFNGDLSTWNLSNVIYIEGMLYNAIGFSGGDLTKWNFNRVTSMKDLFKFASTFTGDISTWDVSRVESFSGTFAETDEFNGDISQWDMGSAVATDEMFYDNPVFSGDLSIWNTSNLQNTWHMFWNANSFNGDLSNWDVSNLVSAAGMFYDADAYNHSLCEWGDRLPVVANVFGMFNATSCNDERDPSRDEDDMNLVGPFCAVC